MGNAVALAILTTTGWVMLYCKLPKGVKKFLLKHHLLTDAGCLLLTYYVLGGTLTALIASAICDIMISALIHMARNEQDYLFVWDMKDYLQTTFSNGMKKIEAYGKEYREKKLGEINVA